ncbi:MAG: glycyl-radical enzyme activating protein, partial [Ruthenibacterium sp.]
MNDFLNVMDVERFATKDGPGIRTVVFLKGCPLHCPWCANPESQSAAQQLLHFANKCTACGTCAAVCAQGAPQLVSGKKPQFDRAKCTACGLCAQSCPAGALRLCGAMRTQQSVLAEVLRDQDYYTASNGGVTISGGEPLLQTD